MGGDSKNIRMSKHSGAQVQKQTGVAISLVCVAHFCSHFNLMLLPPLLPVIAEYLETGFTQIGFALMAYSVVSALTQAPIGFLVDRVGAPVILVAGVCLEGLAFAAIGLAPTFSVFVMLLGIAGIANAVYHPANYSILNQVVPSARIGRAFSYHTASGLFGEALAPASVLLLSALIGWRYALVACGLVSVTVAVVMLLNMQLLKSSAAERRGDQPQDSSRSRSARQLLLSAPVVMGLLFFVGISLTTRGVNGFSVSALHVGHGMSLGAAGTLLSVWLIAAPLGVLAGGQLADRHAQHAQLIGSCFLVISVCLGGLVFVAPNFALSALLFAIGGFAAGVVSPSRDMLIRSITPPGQSGKVFGFVSTGFNIGGMLAPPIYGFLLDRSMANGVFWMAALASMLTIVTVLSTRRLGRTRLAAG